MIKFSKYPVGQEAMTWQSFSPPFYPDDVGKTHISVGITVSKTQIFIAAAASCAVFGVVLTSMVAALFI